MEGGALACELRVAVRCDARVELEAGARGLAAGRARASCVTGLRIYSLITMHTYCVAAAITSHLAPPTTQVSEATAQTGVIAQGYMTGVRTAGSSEQVQRPWG